MKNSTGRIVGAVLRTATAIALGAVVSACEGMEGLKPTTYGGGANAVQPRSAALNGSPTPPVGNPAGGGAPLLGGGSPPPDMSHAAGGAPPPDYVTGGDAADANAPFKSVTVFFGTDRKENPVAAPNERFTAAPGDLVYGTCTVSIPKTHERGELEEPHWWKFEIAEDPKKHVVLTNVQVQSRETFVGTLSAIASMEHNLLLFIHGYNVDFRDAARRTAQIAYDVGYPGVPVLYSWPSHGSTAAYPADEDNNEWTRPHLAEFLSTIASAQGVQRLDVVAHSMGNRALCGALAELARARSDVKIRHLVLAAPDIDARIFVRDLWPDLRKLCEDVTLYASSDDEALKASSKFHQDPRVGQSGAGLVLLDGLSTIDATGIDTSLLGHSYVGAVGKVLDDLRDYLGRLRKPEERALTRKKRGSLAYWVFQ